ncbi:methenyltetrahydrofolate cyclohydrolase [Flavobacterium album]|uniref:Methenyltetrahydrofolate cyclohydrolase n=1 Tax=Flavobacterium album TaxID=2175091 RepID=A0A2S1QV30_9FLAO|nr:cyclodeaminase/cyclohydrolase family protein [Flavobacterium album]AWH84245.1 methenyltetrahydrofolate cyclohydrolase [Flavobacterium album]
MNLIEKTVADLMKKFGEGNHKPGSGSAAAFQGMVSAKLISTVISLTTEEKRRKQYGNIFTEILDFQEQIENRIYPSLTRLFQIDSEQFDKTIILRTERDNEEDEIKKNQLRLEALEQLKTSIDIPLEIGLLCKELAEIAAYIFDYGFKAARGDSQVGLSGAVSAISGCISIIRLNVLSYSSDEYQYTKSVVAKVDSLDKVYQELSIVVNARIRVLQDEYDAKVPLFEGINEIIKKYRADKKLKIENCARDLQNLIWANKNLIWKKNTPNDVLEILRPDIIFRQVLGYGYIENGRYAVAYEDGGDVEVAGVIDQPNKLVAVSNNYSDEVRRFTAAHELGHAILHSQPILHRDIPCDSIGIRKSRDYTEVEADKFATYFLMPERIILREFHRIYSVPQFQLNEDLAFKFGGRSTIDLRRECKDRRGLSRKLASAELYNDNYFTSLSKLFGVSIEAMAIRLEELNLVLY